MRVVRYFAAVLPSGGRKRQNRSPCAYYTLYCHIFQRNFRTVYIPLHTNHGAGRRLQKTEGALKISEHLSPLFCYLRFSYIFSHILFTSPKFNKIAPCLKQTYSVRTALKGFILHLYRVIFPKTYRTYIIIPVWSFHKRIKTATWTTILQIFPLPAAFQTKSRPAQKYAQYGQRAQMYLRMSKARHAVRSVPGR